VLSFPLQKATTGAPMATPSDKTLPDIAIYPDLNITIRTPAGREYRGQALEHDSQHVAGEKWYQVMNLTPTGKGNLHDNAVLKQHFERSGRPSYFSTGRRSRARDQEAGQELHRHPPAGLPRSPYFSPGVISARLIKLGLLERPRKCDFSEPSPSGLAR
jgi:hypothetical protein